MVFRTREGPAFRLTFKDGALVMIENETTPAVGRLKPGTLGAPGMPGVPVPPPASGAPGAPGAPKPPAVDEGDVPQPVGRPPATSDE